MDFNAKITDLNGDGQLDVVFWIGEWGPGCGNQGICPHEVYFESKGKMVQTLQKGGHGISLLGKDKNGIREVAVSGPFYGDLEIIKREEVYQYKDGKYRLYRFRFTLAKSAAEFRKVDGGLSCLSLRF